MISREMLFQGRYIIIVVGLGICQPQLEGSMTFTESTIDETAL
jgi:hypothetical protein